jgi:DNA-binding SARP family transcriptional activator/tetratricopeptide (TPR) repeat protein
MRFGLLGSLEVVDDSGAPVDVGGAQPRLLLAMLLAAGGRIVAVDALIEAVWSEHPPASAAGTLQSYVSRLRRQLEPGRAAGGDAKVLLWEPPGYRLDVDREQVDFRRFERLADEGRELLDAGDAAEARTVLLDADALWRGPALLEFADHEFARGVAARLEERRLVAIEDRIAAELALGRHTAVVGELTQLTSQFPLREGLWAHLALALYRSGRQAHALRAIDDMRRTLVDELGVDPSRPIRELEARILDHDPALDLPVGGGTPSAPLPPVSGPAERIGVHVEGAATERLVGRRVERAAVLAALDDAVAGHARLLLVEGEPGIGKSRLLEELGDEASRRGADVFWARSHEAGAAPAFWPWLGPLRAMLDAELVEGPGPPGTEMVVRLLSASADDEVLTPADSGRFPLFEAITRVLERAARRRPLVILLDDLQWADQASLELVEFLAGRLVGAAVLLAASVRELDIGRDDAVVRTLGAVSRRPTARRVQLNGVSRAETAELIELATGVPAAPALTTAIHARAEGNPFFIGELARFVVTGDGAPPEELVRRTGVPASVRDVVRRRLAGLPPSSVELLQVAAVIGRDVELGLLTRTADQSPEACLDALEPAVADRLLVEVPGSPSTFRFAHTLVREVVLDDASVLRRTRYHLRVADALEAAGRAEDDAEIFADHLWRAVPLGVGRRAAEALERAAEVAVRRRAFETAEAHLERAVQVRRSAGAERADLEAELITINRLSAVRRLRHGYTRATASTPMERARELARRTDRFDLLTELLWVEWAGASTACDLPVAEQLVDQLVASAAESDDPIVQIVARSAYGIQCWQTGRIAEARRRLDEALAEAPVPGTLPMPRGAVVENRILGEGFRAVVHVLAGAGDDELEELELAAAGLTEPYHRLIAWTFLAMGRVLAGDWPAARGWAQRAIETDPKLSFAFFRGSAESVLGWSLVELGEIEEGIALLAGGVAGHRRLGVATLLPLYTAAQGVGHARADRHAEAEQLIRAARAELGRTGERWIEPFVLAAQAEVDLLGGAKPSDVTALLAEALGIARAQGADGSAARVEATALRLGVELGN